MSLVSLIIEALSQLRDTSISSPTNGQTLLYNSIIARWTNGSISSVGAPILKGPYPVNYTDIPTDGSSMTLWTPAIGDIVLRMFIDWQTTIQWNSGTLIVGQNATFVGGVAKNAFLYSDHGDLDGPNSDNLDSITTAVQAYQSDANGNARKDTAYVFHTTSPMKITLVNVAPDPNPTQGHVDIYALIGRAVAP